MLLLSYWFGGKAATHYMWRKAIRIAEKKFREQRSNLIVATSFGSVVALSMDVPKVPMVRSGPNVFRCAQYPVTSPVGLSRT